MLPDQIQGAHLVGIAIGKRVGLAEVVEEREWNRLVAFERVVGEVEAGFDTRARIPPADFAEQLPDGARVVIGPSVVRRVGSRQKTIPAIECTAHLEIELASTERSAGCLDRCAGELATVLGLDRQRSAEGVEPEHRVRAGHQIDPRDRRARDQIPVDDIAEGLVDAHAIEEHRQSLRRAENGRSGEATKVDVGLVRIALRGIGRDAAGVVEHEVAEGWPALPIDFARAKRLHIGRDILERNAESGQRGRADHLHRGKLNDRVLRIGGLNLSCRERFENRSPEGRVMPARCSKPDLVRVAKCHAGPRRDFC